MFDDLVDCIEWPGLEVLVVCLLDTGVNRTHPLIEPALSADDAQAIDETWAVNDHYDGQGRGKPMAGL